MALDPTEIVVAGIGFVYLAPVGTDFPAFDVDPTTAGFTELGYITPDGAKYSFKRDVADIEAWQSLDPVRKVVKKLPKTIGFALQQSNTETLVLALGGGTVTEDTGVFTYEPPAVSSVDERAMIVEYIDDDVKFRWYYFRSQNDAGVDFNPTRGKEVAFQIEMSVLTPVGGGIPFYFETNSPAFSVAS